jgi:peptide/nickel transport system substrate-binding protein
MGSGPYQLTSVSASLTYTFDHFAGYWNKSHVYPAHYVMLAISSENARFNAVKTGVADMTSISALTYPQALADKSLQTTVYQSFSVWSVFMNNKISPLDNSQVREAVSLALDRPTFNVSQEGLCSPINQVFSPGLAGYIKGYSGLGTDVVKAKQLIQAAGATGATIKMLSISIEPYNTFARLVQAQLAAIGLKVEIVVSPTTTFRAMYGQGGYGMLLSPTTVTGADPSQVVDQFYVGVSNPGTKDPTLVAKIAQAEQMSLGTSQRDSAFQDINKDLTTKDLAWAPICQQTNIFVANKQIIGLGSMPDSALIGSSDSSYVQIAK